MECAGHVARKEEEINVDYLLTRKPEGRRALGLGYRLGDNIMRHLKK
jgi:hypothetical protein